MAIEVTTADADDIDRWNRYVERSPHGTAFHELEALRTLADHSKTELHLLVGRKGQESVGIFPIFELRKAGVSAVFSPPPRLLVTFLGPALLNFQNLKQRKAERRHAQFVEGCLDWIDEEIDPRYTHIRTPLGYDDLRPYSWNGFEVTPRYTYTVDLTGDPDDLQMQFSSDARRNIRNTDDSAYEIREGDENAIRRIIRRIRQRYEEQDETYLLSSPFVVDLYRRLPEGRVRPIECYVGGEFVGGIIAIDDGTTLSRWQGSARHDLDVPVNDLLDWHLMATGMEEGRDAYDLVGANTRRLNRYKSKFAPDLRTYHSLEAGTTMVSLLTSVYKKYYAK